MAELRAAGETWTQIAARIRADERVGALTAFRLAHGLSQQEVADQWNGLLPAGQGDRPLTDKQISYWETWPHSGREPSLTALKRLAQIYQCDTKDLIDDGDYSHLDRASTESAPAEAITGNLLTPPRDMRLPLELAELLSDQIRPLMLLDNNGRISARQRDDAYARLVRFLIGWADTMERRVLLRILGWATSAAMAAPVFTMLDADAQERIAGVIATPSRVDETAIGHIEAVLQRCRLQDDVLGAQATLDTVLAQRGLVQAMLTECPDRLRPRLLSVYGDLSRQTGWLSFDLKDFDGAWYYYEEARTAAHEAQNNALAAATLCQMSYLATWQRKPRVAIDHAIAAQGWADRTDDAPLRAYAHQMAARAYAMDAADATSRSQGHTELEHAEAAMADNSPESVMYFNGRAQLLWDQSRFFLYVGDPTAAAAKAQKSLSLLGPSFVRDRAFTILLLGTTHLQTGEVEHAATLIGEVVELTARNHSARLMEEVKDTLHGLDKWNDVPAVRDLKERYRSLAAASPGRRTDPA
ncbi:MAG TPA: helix-turn-helix transcriptional regulator [Streptosporangiaceae bacterium]|nr:helix-turn-helix transcriptional regulator [Streptosporangiaceae bacterium]